MNKLTSTCSQEQQDHMHTHTQSSLKANSPINWFSCDVGNQWSGSKGQLILGYISGEILECHGTIACGMLFRKIWYKTQSFLSRAFKHAFIYAQLNSHRYKSPITAIQCAHISVLHRKLQHSASMNGILHEIVDKLVQNRSRYSIQDIAMWRPLSGHDVRMYYVSSTPIPRRRHQHKMTAQELLGKTWYCLHNPTFT